MPTGNTTPQSATTKECLQWIQHLSQTPRGYFDIWGIVKQPTESEEGINANRRELKEEHKAYENAKESREDLYIKQALKYRAQIEAVQSRSADKAEKREAKGAASISPSHGVWITQHDHSYLQSNSDNNTLGDIPDIGLDIIDMTPNMEGEQENESGETNMDTSRYTNQSLLHSYSSKDMMMNTDVTWHMQHVVRWRKQILCLPLMNKPWVQLTRAHPGQLTSWTQGDNTCHNE